MLTHEIVYKTLDENPGSTAKELSEKLGYSRSYVKNILSQLHSAGEVYFEREGHKGKPCIGIGHVCRWYP